ncbi:unnamed protein product [Spirodela intermedia]|uniref:Uncharacterized protein n=1 Tax=Spirodela intermedia TaxID=51605 RepID=A0A7I8IC94_SPIIN|nr:unnamed protein product [Spirodela intermedia]CAA6655241.1 unnamed protein product [Spirodela intermedia]
MRRAHFLAPRRSRASTPTAPSATINSTQTAEDPTLSPLHSTNPPRSGSPPLPDRVRRRRLRDFFPRRGGRERSQVLLLSLRRGWRHRYRLWCWRSFSPRSARRDRRLVSPFAAALRPSPRPSAFSPTPSAPEAPGLQSPFHSPPAPPSDDNLLPDEAPSPSPYSSSPSDASPSSESPLPSDSPALAPSGEPTQKLDKAGNLSAEAQPSGGGGGG